MKTLKFKSTIKCSGCLGTVTPYLDKTAGAGNWQVDLKNPDKVLSVTTEGVTADQIRDAVEEAGYAAEFIN